MNSEKLMSRRDWTRLALATSVVGIGTAQSQTIATPAAPVRTESRSLDELHKAALAEGGQLLVYGGGDLPNGAAGMESAFMKRFPGMKIRILIDRSKYQGVRIDNQLARGQLQPDVVHILAHNYYDRWKAEGALLPYKPAGSDQVYPGFNDPDGCWTAVFIFAFSSYVNTGLLAEAQAPRDAVDFLDPGLKGKIALTYPHDDDSILYQFDRIIAKQGWDWMDRLLKQDVLWVRGSGVNRALIDRGERAVSFNTSGALVAPPTAKTRFLLPRTDSFLSWAHPASIFAKARHPDAARLYLSWLLSPEMQGTARAWSVRRDMPPPQGYGPITDYNTSPLGFRDYLRDRVRLEKIRDQLEQLIGPMAGANPTQVEGVFPEGRAA